MNLHRSQVGFHTQSVSTRTGLAPAPHDTHPEDTTCLGLTWAFLALAPRALGPEYELLVVGAVPGVTGFPPAPWSPLREMPGARLSPDRGTVRTPALPRARPQSETEQQPGRAAAGPTVLTSPKPDKYKPQTHRTTAQKSTPKPRGKKKNQTKPNPTKKPSFRQITHTRSYGPAGTGL